jgi:DNA-binding GntR family transcriptional regulator
MKPRTARPVSSAAPAGRGKESEEQRPVGRQHAAVVSLLSDKAYDLIRKDIIQCRLPPGKEISETGLTQMYDFGKAPIRAALLRLSQDNLVTSVPRRGYVVTPITIANIQEIYQLRMILEPATARLATSHCDIAALTSLCKRMHSSRSSISTLEYLEVHHAFHVGIASAAGNARLTHLVSLLLHDMARIIHFGEFAPGRGEKLALDHRIQNQQHEAIVTALSAGDANLVERVMLEHIEHSLMMVKEATFASRSLVRM